jgi:hypothetical protein
MGTLQVSADSAGAYPSTGLYGQLEITGLSNTAQRLALGYNTSNNAGYIQAILNASAFEPLLLNPSGGVVGVGTVAPAYSLDVSKGVGFSGTARFFDQTAVTGTTLVTITPGAAQTAASTILAVGGVASFASINNTSASFLFNGHTCTIVATVVTCP